MLVPFVFEIFHYDREYPLYSWVFYRFLSIVGKDGFVIAQENHYGRIDEKRKEYFLENSKVMGYSLPSNRELDRLREVQITNQETAKTLSKYKDRYTAAKEIIVKRDIDLEKILENRLQKIEAMQGKKVEAIITWVGLKSIYEVAKKRGIPVITMELSAIRKPSYQMTLGHFSFQDKYDKRGTREDYEQFLKEMKEESVPILNRRELLSLFLPTEKLDLIEKKDGLEQYEVGVSPGIKEDFFFDNFQKEPLEETLAKVGQQFKENEVSIRFHPLYAWDLDTKGWAIDDSKTSYEWILKCKRIVSTVSNVGFEAMLFGKTAYVLSDYMPFSFMAVPSLTYIEDAVVDLKYLNYMIFSYYVPWDLLFDKEYIKWRFMNKSPRERYLFHMNYIKKKYKIREKLDFTAILKKIHHLKEKELEYYESSSGTRLYQEITKRLERCEIMEKERNIYKRELNQILNSTSWKVTKPLRTVSGKLKKK